MTSLRPLTRERGTELHAPWLVQVRRRLGDHDELDLLTTVARPLAIPDFCTRSARPDTELRHMPDDAGRPAQPRRHIYDFTSTASAACPTGTQTNAGTNTNRVRLLDQTNIPPVEHEETFHATVPDVGAAVQHQPKENIGSRGLAR